MKTNNMTPIKVVIELAYTDVDFRENKVSLRAKIKGDKKYKFHKRYDDFDLSSETEPEIIKDVKQGLQLSNEKIKVEFQL